MSRTARHPFVRITASTAALVAALVLPVAITATAPTTTSTVLASVEEPDSWAWG